MQAVIFDVGGVLLVPHPSPVQTALADFDLALTETLAERAHYLGVQALDATDPEGDDRLAYLHAYATALGVPAPDLPAAVAALKRLWSGPNIELWRLRTSGSAAALKALAATPCKLGIVSNADGSIEAQLRVHAICQVGAGLGVPVLAIVDSGIVGVAKPAADIFRHALEPMGVAPEEALYVGDTVRYDVRGARAAGIVPVHFDPLGLCAGRSDHAHIAQLTELSSLAPLDLSGQK